MFENNTDRMFWTIAVLILGATLLMIGNKAFPKVQDSIMSTISQNIKTGNNSADNASAAAKNAANYSFKNLNQKQNPDDTDSAKKEDIKTMGIFSYNYKSDGSINITGFNENPENDEESQKLQHAQYGGPLNFPKWGPAKNSNKASDAVPVTGINDDNEHPYAFATYGNTVNISDSVKKIGKDTFGIYDLQKLHLGNSLEVIDDEAFLNCNFEPGSNGNFNSLVIPDSVKYIGNQAFGSASQNGIGHLELGKSIEYIGDWAFGSYGEILVKDWQNLNSSSFDKLPNSETDSSLYSDFTLPESLKHIGDQGLNVTVGNLDIPSSIDDDSIYSVPRTVSGKYNIPASISHINLQNFIEKHTHWDYGPSVITLHKSTKIDDPDTLDNINDPESDSNLKINFVD